MVGIETAADRLMRSLDYRLADGVEPLSRTQVAVVLHALADHTSITAALAHRPDDASPWPQATSMGRWFHDVADDLERDERPSLIEAINKDLDEPLYRWDGDADQGARALASRVRSILSTYSGPADLITRVKDALDQDVSPTLGNAAHGFDLVVSRVRAALTAYRMENPA